MHFSSHGDIYTQADSMVTGSQLGLVLAGIFLVELERTMLSTLRNYISPWIEEESTENVLSKLNGYHNNIEFTYKIENDGKLLLLDVLLLRKDYEVETTVYWKSTNSGIYLDW